MKMTQLDAQQVVTATLATQIGPLPRGTTVTLVWQRTFLPEQRYTGVHAQLVHEYKGFGFDPLTGKYTEVLVQDSALEDIVRINFDICGKKG